MNNVVILPEFVYLALLFVLLVVGLSIILIGLTLRRILYYIQMTGIDVCESKMVTRSTEKKILDKIGRDGNAETTRLIYIKGQLDRVLNNQLRFKK